MAEKGKTAKPGNETPAAESVSEPVSVPAVAPAKKRKRRVRKPKTVPELAHQHSTRKKNKGNSVQKTVTTTKEAQMLERRVLVWELVKARTSVRKIHRQLNSQAIKCSVMTVQNDIRWCLDNGAQELVLDIKDHLKIELATLDELQLAYWIPAIKDRDTESGRLILNIMKERDRYLNISKAQRADVDAKSALAKLFGVDPEDLPDDRSEFD